MFSKLGKKITNTQFDLRLSDTNLVRIDDYINSNTSIRFKCINCDKEYKCKPKDLNRIQCKCDEKHENYTKEILSKNIIPIERYKNAFHKIKHKCLNCENEFITSPKVLKNSVIGCPSCSGKKFTKEKYESLLPNNINLIDETYNGSGIEHNHKCLTCDYSFKTKPNYILHMNTNCPNCNSSKGERIISDFLNRLDIKFTKEYSIKINESIYRFDFYLEDYDIFIEYDGIQHFQSVNFFGGLSNLEKVIKNDNLKDHWILENDKKLIRISYLEDPIEKLSFLEFPKDLKDFIIENNLDKINYNNFYNVNIIGVFNVWKDDWLYKTDIIKSMLLNNNGKTPFKIYARKCKVGIIEDNRVVRDFLNKNHLQGYVGSKIKLGLFYKGELVSLMTFGNLRRSTGLKSKPGSYELIRFCNKLNMSVVGGASKLLNYFINNNRFTEIISYANLDHSNGNLYEKIGFKLSHRTKPGYYYIVDGVRRNRYNFTNNENYIKTLYKKVYNLGNLKYVYEIHKNI
jgi:DNA-directed RNA polymerase subunit RPC12/RpoP/very-short-patch-repair endonuclease